MRSLDDLYVEFNGIYLDANFYKDEYQVFSHLVEVIGGLSSVASEKKDPRETVRKYMPKAIAWWFALAGKMGVSSVEDMIWVKYPAICPYCMLSVHDKKKCKSSNPARHEPDWQVLADRGSEGRSKRPRGIEEWRAMFRKIYPVSEAEHMTSAFARLTEELGELAEAVRVRKIAPAYFVSEASDVFAWLMRVQNWYDLHSTDDDASLDHWLADSYPGYCRDCGQATCGCPAVLDSAFGRMAHEVPIEVLPKALIPIDDSFVRFKQRMLIYRGQSYTPTPSDLDRLQEGINSVLALLDQDREISGFQNAALMETLERLSKVQTTTAVSSIVIEQLVQQVGSLPDETQSEIRAIVSSIGSNLFTWLFTLALTGGTGTFASIG